jgi:hypothetical protein
MTDLQKLRDELFILCRYDEDEPNYKIYNISLLKTIEKLPTQSVKYALDSLKRLNND